MAIVRRRVLSRASLVDSVMRSLIFFPLITLSSGACTPSPFIFASDMVLSRSSPRIFGSGGTPGDPVSLSFNGLTFNSTVSPSGSFDLAAPPQPPGGPFNFTLTCGPDATTLRRVLLGDVLACLGSGNAALTLSGVFNAAAEIAATASYSAGIRLFAPAPAASAAPLSALPSPALPWAPASPASVSGGNWTTFSAFCWFSAARLFDALNGAVPIGVVAFTHGAAPLAAWLPSGAGSSCPAPPAPPAGAPPPSSVWNALLAPWAPPAGGAPPLFSAAAMWLGEREAPPLAAGGGAWVGCALTALAGSLGGRPTAVVQAPPAPGPSVTDDWADVRAAQAAAAAALGSGGALVVTADLGDAGSPFSALYGRNKSAVGGRVAAALAARAYGHSAPFIAPRAVRATVVSASNATPDVTVLVEFDPASVASGLAVDADAACPPGLPHDDSNNGWGASSCVGWRVRSSTPTFPPPPLYTAQVPGGFIGAGNDLPGGGMMTVAAAEAACTADPACVGFTFANDSPTPAGEVNIYLKSRYYFTRAPGWQTYNSTRPSAGLFYDVKPSSVAVGGDGKSLLINATLPAVGLGVDKIQYGWATWPLSSVANGAGLPAEPFMLPVGGGSGQARGRRAQAAPWLSLQPLAWAPLPLGAVKPAGWLKAQLAAQVAGQAGSLHKFYPPVADSPWISNCSMPGGCKDTNEGEDFAYWFAAAVPMAVLSQDPSLMADVKGFVDTILASQDARGWLGPPISDSDGNGHWARWPVIAGLLDYHAATGDARILPALYRYMAEAYRRLTQAGPLGGDWAGSRWQDFAWVIQTLLDRDPSDSAGQAQALVSLLWTVYSQQSVDWETWFTTPYFPTGDTGCASAASRPAPPTLSLFQTHTHTHIFTPTHARARTHTHTHRARELLFSWRKYRAGAEKRCHSVSLVWLCASRGFLPPPAGAAGHLAWRAHGLLFCG